jgi:hypothetical protein
MPIVDESRLIPIPDLREWYPKLNFSGRSELVTAGEPIFATDPIYLADIFNPNDDPHATYLREKGVVVSDFGGDTAVPVWWKPPFLVAPTALFKLQKKPPGAKRLVEVIGCDSASFVFLVLNDDVPAALRREIDKVEQQRVGARLKLPAGTYRFHLEQFTPEEEHKQWPHWYRNVVARRTDGAFELDEASDRAGGIIPIGRARRRPDR